MAMVRKELDDRIAQLNLVSREDLANFAVPHSPASPAQARSRAAEKAKTAEGQRPSKAARQAGPKAASKAAGQGRGQGQAGKAAKAHQAGEARPPRPPPRRRKKAGGTKTAPQGGQASPATKQADRAETQAAAKRPRRRARRRRRRAAPAVRHRRQRREGLSAARRRLDLELVPPGPGPEPGSGAATPSPRAGSRWAARPADKPARLVGPGEPHRGQRRRRRGPAAAARSSTPRSTRWPIEVERPAVPGRRRLDRGFTDCCSRGAPAEVVAVDVGRGQLHERLRRDPRVVAARPHQHRGPARSPTSGARRSRSWSPTCRSSPCARWRRCSPAELAAAGAELVWLVKPQFEAGREVVRPGRGRHARPRRSGAAPWSASVTRSAGAGAAIMGAMGSPLAGCRRQRRVPDVGPGPHRRRRRRRRRAAADRAVRAGVRAVSSRRRRAGGPPASGPLAAHLAARDRRAGCGPRATRSGSRRPTPTSPALSAGSSRRGVRRRARRGGQPRRRRHHAAHRAAWSPAPASRCSASTWATSAT